MNPHFPESSRHLIPFFGWSAVTGLSAAQGWAGRCPAGHARREVEMQLSCFKHHYTLFYIDKLRLNGYCGDRSLEGLPLRLGLFFPTLIEHLYEVAGKSPLGASHVIK
jgi:hypothetical protein